MPATPLNIPCITCGARMRGQLPALPPGAGLMLSRVIPGFTTAGVDGAQLAQLFAIECPRCTADARFDASQLSLIGP